MLDDTGGAIVQIPPRLMTKTGMKEGNEFICEAVDEMIILTFKHKAVLRD